MLDAGFCMTDAGSINIEDLAAVLDEVNKSEIRNPKSEIFYSCPCS